MTSHDRSGSQSSTGARSAADAGLDLDRLVDVAASILDAAAPRFTEGLGAGSAVDKGGSDFATELDLELERFIASELSSRTGIGVHGEEYGGPPVDTGVVWVVDPIDGTFNYSAGLPLDGMLAALLIDGDPVIGLTWLPLLGTTYTAVAGGRLHVNGVARPALATGSLREAMISFGAFNVASRGRYPGRWRHAALGEISKRSSRLRLFGSTGVDLAYCAAGMLGGAVVFGHNAWDNAPGVALVRAAGGIVTDLAGEPWTIASHSVLAGAPGVHDELLTLLRGLGDPAHFTPSISTPTATNTPAATTTPAATSAPTEEDIQES